MHLRQIENGNGQGTVTVTERHGTARYGTVTLQNRNFHCMFFDIFCLGENFKFYLL